MNITTNLIIDFDLVETVTIGQGSGTVPTALDYALALANGTGSGKAQLSWSSPAGHTTPAGAPETWVLSALTDSLGRTIAFAKVRALILINQSQTDGQFLMVGGAATHPWSDPFGSGTDRIKVRAGGVLVLVAPLLTAHTVTAGSSDQLMIDPGAATIPYQLAIVGE